MNSHAIWLLKFYKKLKHARPPEYLPGVKNLDSEELGPFTAAHARAFSSDGDAEDAWASVILYSHASPDDDVPKYHGRGELGVHHILRWLIKHVYSKDTR
jgi:hypothetical protein